MTETSLAGFAAVVLAAGRSERMGPRNKLLEPVSDKPLLAHALETIASLELGDVIVVTGHEQAAVAELARRYGARIAHNPSYREGMGASLACGARAVGSHAAGVFIHLADVPFVLASTYRALARALTADQDEVNQAFAPVHAGRRGHPVLFRNVMLPHLCGLSGDEGARRMICANTCLQVDVVDPYIDRDIDTEADLKRIANFQISS